MEILKVENLTKVYGKGENEVRALNGVSFSVERVILLRLSGLRAAANQLFCTHWAALTAPRGAKCL